MVDYVFTDNSGNVVKVRTDAVDTNINNFTVLEVNDQPGGISGVAAALQKIIGKKLDIGTTGGDLSTGGSLAYFIALATALSMTLTAYPVGAAVSTPVVKLAPTLGTPVLTGATGTGAAGTDHMTWVAVPNATNYVLDRATNVGFTTGVTLGVYSGPLLVFNDSGLTAATQYFYRLRAQGAGYTDSAYGTASATTHA